MKRRYLTGLGLLLVLGVLIIAGWSWGNQSASAQAIASINTAPSVSAGCSELSYPVYVCTGSVSGGVSPYTPYWNGYQWPAGSGPTFSIQTICKRGYGNYYNVSFQVRDATGAWSNTRTAYCPGLEP